MFAEHLKVINETNGKYVVDLIGSKEPLAKKSIESIKIELRPFYMIGSLLDLSEHERVSILDLEQNDCRFNRPEQISILLDIKDYKNRLIEGQLTQALKASAKLAAAAFPDSVYFASVEVISSAQKMKTLLICILKEGSSSNHFNVRISNITDYQYFL
jgi:hypothetical protein